MACTACNWYVVQVLRFHNHACTEHNGRVRSTPVSHGHRFQSWAKLRSHVAFLNPSRQYPGQYLSSGQDNFLNHTFQVNHLSYNFILQSKPLRVLLNIPCKMYSFEDFSLYLTVTDVGSIILLLFMLSLL